MLVPSFPSLRFPPDCVLVLIFPWHPSREVPEYLAKELGAAENPWSWDDQVLVEMECVLRSFMVFTLFLLCGWSAEEDESDKTWMDKSVYCPAHVIIHDRDDNHLLKDAGRLLPDSKTWAPAHSFPTPQALPKAENRDTGQENVLGWRRSRRNGWQTG